MQIKPSEISRLDGLQLSNVFNLLLSFTILVFGTHIVTQGTIFGMYVKIATVTSKINNSIIDLNKNVKMLILLNLSIFDRNNVQKSLITCFFVKVRFKVFNVFWQTLN